jgi:hypothetical protein
MRDSRPRGQVGAAASPSRAAAEQRSAGYGPVPTFVVTKYLEDLVRVGLVKWK